MSPGNQVVIILLMIILEEHQIVRIKYFTWIKITNNDFKKSFYNNCFSKMFC